MIPKIMLDKICEIYKIMPSLMFLSIPTPTAPITKIGPEVVQKIDIRFASSSVIRFFE